MRLATKTFAKATVKLVTLTIALDVGHCGVEGGSILCVHFSSSASLRAMCSSTAAEASVCILSPRFLQKAFSLRCTGLRMGTEGIVLGMSPTMGLFSPLCKPFLEKIPKFPGLCIVEGEMPRPDVTGFKVSTALAGRLDALISGAGVNMSRNQLAEQLLEECCKMAENEEGAAVPATILDLRVRQKKKVILRQADNAERQLIQRVADVEGQVARLIAEAKKTYGKPTT